jgi:hypothetical protein
MPLPNGKIMRYIVCFGLLAGLLMGCEARFHAESGPTAPSRSVAPTPNPTPFNGQADRFVDTTYHVVCYQYWQSISCAPYFPEPTNFRGE